MNNTHIRPIETDDHTRFYLIFQTQHAQIAQVGGRNVITFNEGFIQALGGGNYGLGRPQTLGDEER